MQSVTEFLTKKLRLQVHESKSAVARPWERKFLGFSFTMDPRPKRGLTPQMVKRFRERVRELTRRTRGVSVMPMAEPLRSYWVGWNGYFGRWETPSVLRDLESWIRRRIRCVLWKQRKRGTTRYGELRARGVGRDLASQTAGSSHSPWRLSRSPALSFAFPSSGFERLGLPRLSRSRAT